MKDYLISQQRKKDILNAFLDGIKSFGKYSVSIDDVIAKVMSSGAPRFYVTIENAKRNISLINRGKTLPLRNKNKIEMYLEIFRRYKELSNKLGINDYNLLEEIINSPAPSFYCHPKTFRETIYKYHKENRRKCKRFQ